MQDSLQCRSDASVAACLRTVLDQAGRLDVLVNNAGYELGGALRSAYDAWRQRALDAIRGYEEKGPGPELVAEAVAGIVHSATPGLRYVVGQEAKVVSSLKRFLPERLFEKGARSNFRLDAKQ